MRIIETTTQYRKDFELAKKRNLPIDKLNEIVIKLANDEPLPIINKDHQLRGYNPVIRECHILPDWLLEYRKVDDGIIHLLKLIRTGTHSDLFKK